jgi:hypothetical protein
VRADNDFTETLLCVTEQLNSHTAISQEYFLIAVHDVANRTAIQQHISNDAHHSNNLTAL